MQLKYAWYQWSISEAGYMGGLSITIHFFKGCVCSAHLSLQ